MKKRILTGFATGLFLIGTAGMAQAISITQTNDATSLGNAFGGVTVTSVVGNPDQFGTYTNASNLFGIGDGIVLSTGNVNNYNDGPNTSGSFGSSMGGGGQADLSALGGVPTFDAAYLTFDFVASADQISFDFVFGSDEYPEWVGSGYNDPFGAFFGGVGGTNVSFDQFANPITINSAWMSGNTGTELDGATVLLTTVYGGLTAGNTYSFMLGIADGSDAIYDSTVYLSNFKGVTGQQTGTNPVVPEPATMLLLGTGLAGLAGIRRKKKA